MVVNGKGELERIVSIVALRIEDRFTRQPHGQTSGSYKLLCFALASAAFMCSSQFRKSRGRSFEALMPISGDILGSRPFAQIR